MSFFALSWAVVALAGSIGEAIITAEGGNGCDVSMDGTKLGRLPLHAYKIASGRHTFSSTRASPASLSTTSASASAVRPSGQVSAKVWRPLAIL